MSEPKRTRESGHGKQLCPCACHPDLSWLARLGGSQCCPSDVDCLFVVERRGAFLFMEWKWGSEVMPDGQKFTLFALSRVRGFTVLLVRGAKPGSPEGYCVIEDGAFGEPHLTTQGDFRSRVEKWFTTGRWPEGDA